MRTCTLPLEEKLKGVRLFGSIYFLPVDTHSFATCIHKDNSFCLISSLLNCVTSRVTTKKILLILELFIKIFIVCLLGYTK